jgi:hypothetical protein
MLDHGDRLAAVMSVLPAGLGPSGHGDRQHGDRPDCKQGGEQALHGTPPLWV